MEVAQRASKALRFSLDEIQPEQALTNAERIMVEFDDLRAVVYMLQQRALLPSTSDTRLLAKVEKVERFLRYSEQCGTLANNAVSRDPS